MRGINQTTCPRMIVLLLTMLGTSAVAKTIYVDCDATGANNGSSWIDAYWCLQNALAGTRSGDEIRVANGTYKPDRKVVTERSGIRITTSSDPTATFLLVNGVILRGGYAGLGELNPDSRDIHLYETVLSGDLHGNDRSQFVNTSENSYRVVTGRVTGTMTVLDGFTITAGSHHGMYNQSGSPLVTNCIFRGNRADRLGGGMYNDSGSPSLSNCTFEGNLAKYGGAIWSSQGAPILRECTFSGNSAEHGGGMYNCRSCPILTNCKFSHNLAERGGGMYNENKSNPNLINCTFSRNHSLEMKLSGGGSGIYNKESNPTLTDCTFSNNKAQWGGGMSNDNSNPILTNCTFCGNLAGWGGGMYNRNASSPMLTCCTFSGNLANRWGGGICSSKSSLWLSNCTLSINSAPLGEGIYSYDSELMLINCILWGNSASTGLQIHSNGASSATVNYCNVQGDYPGINNINADPMFVDSDGADDTVGTIDDNLQLCIGSPCINTGDNTVVPVSVTTDPTGSRRIVHRIVDMGAFEWSPLSAAPGENVDVSIPVSRITGVFDTVE